MPKQERELGPALWRGILMGAVTLAVTLALLLPAAILMRSSRIVASGAKPAVMVCLALAGVISAWLCRNGRGEGIVRLAAGMLTVLLIHVLLSLAVGEGGADLPRSVLAAALGGVGMLIGTFTIINKKYTPKRKRKRRYNK